MNGIELNVNNIELKAKLTIFGEVIYTEYNNEIWIDLDYAFGNKILKNNMSNIPEDKILIVHDNFSINKMFFTQINYIIKKGNKELCCSISDVFNINDQKNCNENSSKIKYWGKLNKFVKKFIFI